MQHTRELQGMGSWWKRENLLPASALLLITAVAWAWSLRVASGDAMPMPDMDHTAEALGTGPELQSGMELVSHVAATPESTAQWILFLGADLGLFLGGWAIMMIAMMLPAAMPLVLLYRATVRRRLPQRDAVAGVGALLTGYFLTWTLAGVPVFFYGKAVASDATLAVLPAVLLISGGLYQFTVLKNACHTRCSSPFFLLAQHWRPGIYPAARLGVVHGIDCLGCCLGLMLALVGLGMMKVEWMLTAAIIIFAEKTIPGGHHIARPLGVALVVAGISLLFASLRIIQVSV